MPSRDYIPRNWDAFAVWMANFTAQLPTLAAKYGISAAVLTQTTKDNEWVQYWVDAKNAAKLQTRQVNDYVDDVANGNINGQTENDPTWALPAGAADAVPNGVKKRAREVVAGMKAQKTIYTQADGELINVVTAEEANLGEEHFTPELKLRPLANFAVECEFRKQGLNAIKVEFRHKGGNWQLAAFLQTSPGVFNITSTQPDNAEQIEVRAVYFENNANYGNYSAIYPVSIAP